MNGIEKSDVVSEAVTKENITLILQLAYEELMRKPRKYIGYPTSDLVACFLDAEDILGDEFINIFDNLNSEYTNDFEKFKLEIIEPSLKSILKSLSSLKNQEKSKFDFFSKDFGVICNVSLASVLLTVYTYTSKHQSILDEADKKILEKSTQLLLETYIPQKGWQYYYIEDEDKHVHTLSTWLSLIALTNVPEEILTYDIKNRIETIKKEVKNWISENAHDEEKYFSWCFRPEDCEDDEYGENINEPIATAQSIIALNGAGMDLNDKIIKGSIDFIKDNRSKIKTNITDEIPTMRVAQKYQGIHHCLQALLISGIGTEDETVQYLLQKIIGDIDRINKKVRRSALEKYTYYTTLIPLLLYLHPPLNNKSFLCDSAKSKNEFESFISEAKSSILLLGQIDETYAKILSEMELNEDKIMILYRDGQNKKMLENLNWNNECLMESNLMNLNCIIRDEETVLMSQTPFIKYENRSNCYSIHTENVSSFINEIEDVVGKNIRIIDKSIESLSKIIEKDYPNHWNKYMEPTLRSMNPQEHNGLLEYFSHNTNYTEAIPTSLGFKSSEEAEIELANSGIFSRVFTNGTLKSFIKSDIIDKNLILDESSVYLLMKSTRLMENLTSLLSPPIVDELHLLSDMYEDLTKKVNLPNTIKGGLQKIEDTSMDPAIDFGNYYLTDNEKILISYANNNKYSKYGIITNRWEVAKTCSILKINIYSLVKFLDKTEESYKMFRIPIDFIGM